MISPRQLLCAAVLACLPTATAQEVNFEPLKPYFIFQVDVPLGLLPHPDILNPAFGMDGYRIEWMSEADWGDLGIVYAGHHPDAWPDVPPPFKAVRPPKLSRPQAALQRRLQLRAEHRYRGPLWQLEPRLRIEVRPLPVERDQRSGLMIEGTRN